MNSLVSAFKSLINSDMKKVTILSLTASYIYQNFDDVSWAGFYLLDTDASNLYLGPFQGNVACTSIDISRGVCGKCATTKEVIIVPDVNLFPGHIACDALSASEIVLPIIVNGSLEAVLDIDSYSLNRFDAETAKTLEAIANIVIDTITY